MSDVDKLDLSMFTEEFLSDAKEGFLEINRSLLSLEKDFSRKECLDAVFRVFHTLKSASNMLNFTDVSEFAHKGEDFLGRLRKQEIPVNKDTISLLFEITDTAETLVRERVEIGTEKELSPVTADRMAQVRQLIGHYETKEKLSRQGVIVVDQDGVIEAFNPDAERLFGYSAAEVTGRNIGMLVIAPQTQEQKNHAGRDINKDQLRAIAKESGLQAMRKDGVIFPIELAESEVCVNCKPLLILIVKDITVHEIKSLPVLSMEKIQTVKIHVDLIDDLFNLVGELIITRNRLHNILADTSTKELKNVMTSMNHIIAELQEKVSSARMVPVEEIFQKFPRMIRNIAMEKHKEIDLVTQGNETELDKSVLDEIGEPLMHLLRNAVDHGVESPDVRERHGKKRTGTVKLSAQRTENQIIIGVEDDGAGIDAGAVRETALAKGYISKEESESLQERDIFPLLFRPGFSSLSEVTGLSGRGVGLDIVKTVTEKLGGTVEIATLKDHGTRFSMKLPIAPAIMQTLMVGVGRHVFVIPSDMVLETIEVRPENIREIGDRNVFILRKQVLPFIRLKDLLNIDPDEEDKSLVAVIIYRGEHFIALGVNAVIDQIENIIKPLDTVTQQSKGFSGGTILPDGSVALLLDIPGLFGFETFKEEGYTV